MEDQLAAAKVLHNPIQMAAVKATIAAGLLGGVFLLIPGTWNWRITAMVAAAFWVNTFLFSLLSDWARKKVREHFSATQPEA